MEVRDRLAELFPVLRYRQFGQHRPKWTQNGSNIFRVSIVGQPHSFADSEVWSSRKWNNFIRWFYTMLHHFIRKFVTLFPRHLCNKTSFTFTDTHKLFSSIRHRPRWSHYHSLRTVPVDGIQSKDCLKEARNYTLNYKTATNSSSGHILCIIN